VIIPSNHLRAYTIIRRHHMKQVLCFFIILVTMAISMSGCGKNQKVTSVARDEGIHDEDVYALSMMVTSHSEGPMGPSSQVHQAIEDYTKTDLEIIWVPNAIYDDKMNITFASGKLPTVMLVPSKTASVINAARNDVFWDLTPYLQDYPNLSKSNEQVLRNTSIDGHVYGIYRSRRLGRNGISYRKDWLDNLGLEVPKTIDDFHEMLYAFTYNDPDGNGIHDTYGIAITKWNGPWNIMQTWFGAPNAWGFNANGGLIPDFMTDEYMDALHFFNEIYSEGLVNQGFALMESSLWSEPYLAEEAGVIVDVAGFSSVFQSKFENQLGYEEVVWDVIGSVEGPTGYHNLPFSGGYNGMFVITKEGAETEEDLMKTLSFLDKLNDYEMQVTMMYGVEGVHYTYDQDGYYYIYDNDTLLAEFMDAAQLGMGIPTDFRYDPEMPIKRDELMLKRDQVYTDNLDVIVANPCEPFISDTYVNKGDQLDSIIEDARVQFIVGAIDEEGFMEAVNLWQSSGGDEIIKEYNAAYKALNNE